MAIDISDAPLKRETRAFLLCSLALLGAIVVPHSPLPDPSTAQHVQPVSGKLAASRGLRTLSYVARGQVATQPSMIQGWGGITLSEVVGSNLIQRLNQSGYNAIRVSFGTATGFSCLDGELGSWDPALFTQVLQTTQEYNMTVILDYHGYNNPNDQSFQPCWLNFWGTVISQFKTSTGLIWEPVNEPAGTQSDLSAGYQAFINQARGLGDTHWIDVESTCSHSCTFSPSGIAQSFPTLIDSLGRVYISVHPYFFYDQLIGYAIPSTMPSWSNVSAEYVADNYYWGMTNGSALTGWKVLDTEGGAVYYSCNAVCAYPPDAVGTDDASYSTTTFHFIQYLTTLMQSKNMGWLWWEAGEGYCCGALDTWGSLLEFQHVTPPTSQPHSRPPCLLCIPTDGSSILSSAILWLTVGGICGLVLVVLATVFRRKGRSNISKIVSP